MTIVDYESIKDRLISICDTEDKALQKERLRVFMQDLVVFIDGGNHDTKR